MSRPFHWAIAFHIVPIRRCAEWKRRARCWRDRVADARWPVTSILQSAARQLDPI
jgi:hypothetical protein